MREPVRGEAAGRPVIGWYVHHHGAGHVTRFLAVRPQLDADVVVFSSMPAPAELPAATEWIVLPRDDEEVAASDGSTWSPVDASPTSRGLLHWAPIGHPGHTSRMSVIATAIGARRFAAFVVDVSVEVTLLVRLLGVAPVVVSQPGDRSDEPHRLAYDAADLVIAPWPDGTHRSSALARVANRVRFVGGISRFEGRPADEVEKGSILFLGGAEARGSSVLAAGLAGAAASTPDARWRALGVDGWETDPWGSLTHAEVVVSWAGQNSVADLAAAGSRAIVLPQARPFGEQVATARALEAGGLAVVSEHWPTDAEWPGLVRRARALRPDWERWQVDGAARRMADAIAEVAQWHRR